jgi:hypothetical protein
MKNSAPREAGPWVRGPAHTHFTSFHFSTKFTDEETGLNYYGYRYCAPSEAWLFLPGGSPGRSPPKGGSLEEQGLTNQPYRVLHG